MAAAAAGASLRPQAHGQSRPAAFMRTDRSLAAASIAIGRANLAAAFPEKSPAEIEAILPASGTISAASRPSSPISTGCTIFADPTTPDAIDIVFDDGRRCALR